MIPDDWQEAMWGSGADLWLRDRGLEDATIKQAGLGYIPAPTPGWERFTGCISIPYQDGRGRTVGVRFRHLTGQQKYDQPSGSPHRLYGVDLIEEAHIFITEGEFDALILRQMGFAAIGCPGAQSWQKHWKWLFRDAERVSIIFDGDEAGRKGASSIARQISKVVAHTGLVPMPEGMDVTDLYLSNPDHLRSLIDG